jgi:hypothetical protein
MSKYKTKAKLITQTGSHKKILINMEIAKETLNPILLKQLNDLLVELNHVQETR